MAAINRVHEVAIDRIEAERLFAFDGILSPPLTFEGRASVPSRS
jgi:hypothetical protein